MSRSRAVARRAAVQAIYQWQVGGNDVGDIERQFLAEQQDLAKGDVEYFGELLRGIPQQVDKLDDELAPLLDRPIREVDPVERAVLRLGVYELMFKPDVPYRVVINEAVELAKLFGAEQGHRYVNGVLDKAARKLRAVELGVGNTR